MLRKVRVICNVFGGCLLSASLFFGEASALEPEHEMRRLMLATEAAVESQSWGEASQYLTRLQQMESEKPAAYLYFRGRVMLESGHFNEARSALEGYVSRAGAESEHYTSALELITKVEKARKNATSGIEQAGAAGSEPVAVIEPAGDTTARDLKELYLADSETEALVIHLNALLGNAGWSPDQRIKRLDRPADLTYQVNRMNDALNIQEARRETGGRITRSTESLNVFGVNTSIDWNCEPAASACWIYDPRDGSRLMRLAENHGNAAEIARTLGKLIRTMQNRN
jgi:hypothetical protein